MSDDRIFIKMYEVGREDKLTAVAETLDGWFRVLPESLWPEYYGEAEPASRPIDNQNRDELIQLATEMGELPTMRRDSEPAYKFGGSQTTTDEGEKEPYGLTCFLDISYDSKSIENVLAFLRFFIESLKPAFAFAEIYEAYSNRHGFIFDLGPGSTIESNRGTHLDETIPGIYYVTYFSKSTVANYDLDLKAVESAECVEELEDGFAIRAFRDPKTSLTEEGESIKKRIMQVLNESSFFDPTSVSLEDIYPV